MGSCLTLAENLEKKIVKLKTKRKVQPNFTSYQKITVHEYDI